MYALSWRMQVLMDQCYRLIIRWFPFALDTIRLEMHFSMTDRSGFGYFRPERCWNLRTHAPSHHALYYASLCLKVPQRRPWNTEIANSSFIFKLAVFQGFVVVLSICHNLYIYLYKVPSIYQNTYFCDWSNQCLLRINHLPGHATIYSYALTVYKIIFLFA